MLSIFKLCMFARSVSVALSEGCYQARLCLTVQALNAYKQVIMKGVSVYATGGCVYTKFAIRQW